MGKQRAIRKPRFWWQALLILLPIAVLAGVGLISIRQDKSLALQEANERARAVAEDILAKVWDRVSATNDAVDFERRGLIIDRDGALVHPPNSPAVPLPRPLDFNQLTSEQSKLWEKAERLRTDPSQVKQVAQTYRDFTALNPPKRFSSLAHYELGLLATHQGSWQDAADAYSTALENSADVFTAAGIPLQPLCGIKLFELQRLKPGLKIQHSTSLDTVCSNILQHPSLLSAWILDTLEDRASSTAAKTTVKKYRSIWQDQERSRDVYRAVASTRGSGKWKADQFVWVSPHSNFDSPIDPGNWLIVPQPKPSLLPMTTRETAHYLSSSTSVATASAPLPKNRVSVEFSSTSIADNGESNTSYGLSNEAPTNRHSFVCWNEAEIGSQLSEIMAREKQIPPYFGVSLEVAGKVVRQSAPDLRVWHDYHHGGKGGGIQRELTSEIATRILATATRPSPPKTDTRAIHVDLNPPSVWNDFGVPGRDQDFKVVVYLTSPPALFERQRARSFWIGTLISVAAATSLLGLFLAWRAFYRQQMLTELKTNFVSSVSHELRAPIASVRLLAESLEGGKIQESKKQHEYFRFIGQECRRLSALIENILDFSRIEQGRKQYEFQPTDLTALTRQTVAVMQTYAAEKEVALELDLAQIAPTETVLEVNIDGHAIQQALVNLIDNAIKHSARGQVVRVGLERPVFGVQCSVFSGEKTADEHGSRFALWVEDNGPGIPSEEHEKIFERFYRLGSELRRETQGVGIGLSLVKHIVEGHGGEVVVRSAPGEGSRFTIELPATSRGER